MITALHAAQTGTSSFLKGMCQMRDQYVIYLKQCLLSLYYKKITVCLEVLVEFHETY